MIVLSNSPLSLSWATIRPMPASMLSIMAAKTSMQRASHALSETAGQSSAGGSSGVSCGTSSLAFIRASRAARCGW